MMVCGYLKYSNIPAVRPEKVKRRAAAMHTVLAIVCMVEVACYSCGRKE
jgi:hypothetical protein